MKSLLDIQQDMRELEDSVKEIVDHVKTIRSDIEDLRNADQDIVTDYGKIMILAKRIPFGGHPLARLEDKRICRIYLEMLLLIVRLGGDAETVLNRLVFLQWLQMQSGIDLSLAELYEDSHKIKQDSYYEFVDAIPIEYRDFFLVDGLIIAGISGVFNREAAEYIADLGMVYGLGKEKLRGLFSLSRVVLIQNIEGVGKGDLYRALQYRKDFGHYLGEAVAEQGIITLRELAVKFPENAVTGLEWKIKNFEMVKAGDTIATYKKVKKNKDNANIFLGGNEDRLEAIKAVIANSACKKIDSPEEESKKEQILAAVSGKLFQFRFKGIWYCVIAHETDDIDSVKEWVKNNGL